MNRENVECKWIFMKLIICIGNNLTPVGVGDALLFFFFRFSVMPLSRKLFISDLKFIIQSHVKRMLHLQLTTSNKISNFALYLVLGSLRLKIMREVSFLEAGGGGQQAHGPIFKGQELYNILGYVM